MRRATSRRCAPPGRGTSARPTARRPARPRAAGSSPRPRTASGPRPRCRPPRPDRRRGAHRSRDWRGSSPSNCFTTSTTGQYVIPLPVGQTPSTDDRGLDCVEELRSETGLADSRSAEDREQRARRLPTRSAPTRRSAMPARGHGRRTARRPDARRRSCPSPLRADMQSADRTSLSRRAGAAAPPRPRRGRARGSARRGALPPSPRLARDGQRR